MLAAVAGHAWLPAAPALAAAPTRAQAWQPNANVLFEWRYIAGRITAGADDYGFIVSLSRPTALLPGRVPELLVMRQSFTGSDFGTNVYPGTLGYDGATGTYSFQANGNAASATARYDAAAQAYRISVTSPELNLADVLLRPQGGLIAEGGDGLIDVGQVLGFTVESDYYADWASVEIGGVARGVARVDMQGLRPKSFSNVPGGDYDHHWFVVAGSITSKSGTQPVWVSAWRIVSGGTFWDVTIATGTGAGWQASSYTEASSVAAPLAVAETLWQPVPALGSTAVRYTGQGWHVAAGASAPGDLLDLTITVPAGQFTSGARAFPDGSLSFLEEGVGFSASGTVLGLPLSDVRLAVAETTAEFALSYLPLALR